MLRNATPWKPLDPGTVSHGTLRTQDLIQTFWDVLVEHHPAKAIVLHDEYTLPDDVKSIEWPKDDDPFWDHDDARYLLDDLYEALDGCCPAGHYFGSHPGDGSDFGCWPADFLD